MHNLLYPGEILDHEEMAKHESDVYHYSSAKLKKGDAVRAYAPSFGPQWKSLPEHLHVITARIRDFSGERIIHCRSGSINGCGFISKENPARGDVIPLKFIKTRARQALENLRTRLDKGVY